MADQRALGQVLYEHLQGAGFDYTAAQAVEARVWPWERPPLLTELELGGEPLQRFLAVKTGKSSDELVEIYERFIAGFIYTQQESKGMTRDSQADYYLRRELGLAAAQAQMLFTRPWFNAKRLGLHLNLVEFAALVAYNHGCHLEHGPDTFVAITIPDARQFGVRDGRLVSNFLKPRRPIPVRFLRWPNRLVDMPRRGVEGGWAPHYDVVRTWLTDNKGRLGSLAESLLLALTIQHWMSPRAAPGWLLFAFSYERSREALEAACREARKYMEFDSPILRLKEIFTPNFVSVADFSQMFGNPNLKSETTKGLQLKWDQAINSLDPGFKEEQQNIQK